MGMFASKSFIEKMEREDRVLERSSATSWKELNAWMWKNEYKARDNYKALNKDRRRQVYEGVLDEMTQYAPGSFEYMGLFSQNYAILHEFAPEYTEDIGIEYENNREQELVHLEQIAAQEKLNEEKRLEIARNKWLEEERARLDAQRRRTTSYRQLEDALDAHFGGASYDY